jgi:hypothetical protein
LLWPRNHTFVPIAVDDRAGNASDCGVTVSVPPNRKTR